MIGPFLPISNRPPPTSGTASAVTGCRGMSGVMSVVVSVPWFPMFGQALRLPGDQPCEARSFLPAASVADRISVFVPIGVVRRLLLGGSGPLFGSRIGRLLYS